MDPQEIVYGDTYKPKEKKIDLKKTIQIPVDVHADIVRLKSREAKSLNLKSMTISDYLSRIVAKEKAGA